MKIDQQTLEDHQVKLSVEVETETLNSARRKAARKIAQRVKVPGFRPGKAPYNVIEKQVGAAAIEEEALDIVLDDVYPKILEESGIKPYGPGTLEKVDEEKEPRIFEIRVPLSPEVELGDYKNIRLDFEEKPVTEKDIQSVLDNLREQQAVLESVDRPAQEGDMVYVQLSAERLKPDKDGETALLKERRYPVVIEREDVDSSNEWPFPGFSRQLMGLSANEEKEIKHPFADDSDFEDLRGESATFKIKVEEIKDRILPELNDEFAKSVGEYDDLPSLRAEVETSLKENFERQQTDEYESRIVEKIIELATIKFPPQMLDHEIEHYLEDLEPQLASQGLTMESYLKSRQIEMADLRAEVRPRVEERLKKSLVLMEVSRKEEIEIPENELQDLVQERITQLQNALSEEDARRLLSGDSLQGLVSRIMTEEIITRTLERLRAIAQGEEIARPAAQAKPADLEVEGTASEAKSKSASETEK